MNSDYSLDGFLEAVEILCDSQTETEKVGGVACAEKELVNAPKLDSSVFSNFRLLMKSPRNKDSPKNTECKKCEITRKRLEEKIDRLETAILFQQDQLFEGYSNLKARLSILEEREQKRVKLNGAI